VIPRRARRRSAGHRWHSLPRRASIGPYASSCA